MRWPKWLRTETRNSPYTDELVAGILSRATNGVSASHKVSAPLEAAAGLVGRAFAAAEVQGPDGYSNVLTPSVLMMIGRGLIRYGEVVFHIGMESGRMALTPVATFDLQGGYRPDSWIYKVNLAGPTATVTKEVSASDVLHFRQAVDADRPWKGQGPLAVANGSARLLAEVQTALADEASGPRGSVIPVPKDGQDPTFAALRADLRGLKGDASLVESVASMMGTDNRAFHDWEAKRIGADPPATMVKLLELAGAENLAAVGLNSAVFGANTGTAAREAWRMALFGVISPLGRIVQSELRAKLDDGITLEWRELRASDLSGRARAFQSMVGGGIEVERAAGLAGLLVPDDD